MIIVYKESCKLLLLSEILTNIKIKTITPLGCLRMDQVDSEDYIFFLLYEK